LLAVFAAARSVLYPRSNYALSNPLGTWLEHCSDFTYVSTHYALNR